MFKEYKFSIVVGYVNGQTDSLSQNVWVFFNWMNTLQIVFYLYLENENWTTGLANGGVHSHIQMLSVELSVNI